MKSHMPSENQKIAEFKNYMLAAENGDVQHGMSLDIDELEPR